jgi:hypothetical protein
MRTIIGSCCRVDRQKRKHGALCLPTRAEPRLLALYVELSGAPRELLGQVIAAFRAALESQREPDITQARERLVSCMSEATRRDR